MIYSYKCSKCESTCEVNRSIHDNEVLPNCCSGPMSRVWDAAPAHFKGGGFYKTGG